ncbi:MAG: hypothetical protein LC749_07955 [Actinobacteria bacterium]|nr:hypothetical protein [Actinomycetota bacterium]
MELEAEQLARRIRRVASSRESLIALRLRIDRPSWSRIKPGASRQGVNPAQVGEVHEQHPVLASDDIAGHCLEFGTWRGATLAAAFHAARRNQLESDALLRVRLV